MICNTCTRMVFFQISKVSKPQKAESGTARHSEQLALGHDPAPAQVPKAPSTHWASKFMKITVFERFGQSI